MKRIVLLLCSFLGMTGMYAQDDSLAIKSFTMHGGNREFGYLGVRMDDNSSALFNITSNCNTAQCAHGMAGIRIDKNGNMIHSQKIGSVTIDVDPNRAIYTADKHILMVGGYESDKRMIIKMDTLFNVVWNRIIELKPDLFFSGPYGDGLVEENNKYYISFANQLTKISPDGNVIFSKYYGPMQGNTAYQNYVSFNSMVSLAPGKLFISGELLDDGPGNYNEYGFISIVDTNGNILKQKKVDVQAPYGAGITHGLRESATKMKIFGHFHNDIYAADVDTNLVVTNVKKYSGTAPVYTHSICYNGTDRYYISSFDHNHAKTSVFALDNNGTVQWSKFLTNGSGYFRSYTYMLDNCAFAVYGSQTYNTQVKNVGFWVKMNEDGSTASSSIELPLSITTTSTITATVTTSTAVDSGQWQTNFSSENFLYDNVAIGDSLWYKANNPVICPETPQGITEVAFNDHKDLCTPNPFYGKMEIGNDWELSKISRLIVYDITGRVILEQDRPSKRTIELTDNIKGLVFVKWMYEGRAYSQKMLAR